MTAAAPEASVREQEELLDALVQDEEAQVPESELRIYRQVDPGVVAPDNVVAYPFRFGGDPFPYYRFTPYYFGGDGNGAGLQGGPSSRTVGGKKGQSAAAKAAGGKKAHPSHKSLSGLPGASEGRPIDRGYPPSAYGYYPYPVQYAYPGVDPRSAAGAYTGEHYYPYGPVYAQPQPQPQPYGYQPQSMQPQGMAAYPRPGVPLPAGSSDEEDDATTTVKSGMMTIQGRRPLFLVALFVVSIAVLLVSFPLTLLSAGYIGPLGLMFATGPFATVFAFWAIYLTPCECYPNIEWATSRIRVFATTAAVFDAVGTIGVPISMYGAQCPDDDDTMLGCEDELPAAKGVSLAVAVVLGTHCFLCLLVRSNARKLAESKFGDERTEGITLTPTPFDRS